MKECLSETAFSALMDGSASAEQITQWKRHLRQCDSCASHFISLQAGHNDFQKAATAQMHDENNLTGKLIPSRLEPNVQIGDFIIEKRLGSGGMGTVYQACQKSLNRKVALKVMSAGILATDKAVERFHKEARAAAKLHHTNIVAIYAEGQEDQTCYYAMELIEGQTLDKIIASLKAGRDENVKNATLNRFFVSNAKTDTFSLKSSDLKNKFLLAQTNPFLEHFDSIARMIADVADALYYVHKNSIIHRDIKPSNLILGTNGRINLMDFGLARMLEEHSVTVTGAFLGTPHYMSPEQVGSSKQKVDHRTDIYSLGVTLYELLTLETPFSGDSHEQIVTQILTREPVRPRKIDNRIPQDLETICCKAMEKEPQRRYQDAGQMAEDLRRYVNRYAIKARKVGSAERMVKFVLRHKVLSVMTAVIAVMTTIAALAGWNYFTYKWVKKSAIPEVKRLIDAGLSLDALKIAQKAHFFAPDDPELSALFSEFTKVVSIRTKPSGAYIYMKPYNKPNSNWTKLGKSPINNMRLAYGLYHWRIVKEGYETLEHRETIQVSMSFALERLGITPAGMVRIDGGTDSINLIGLNQFETDLQDYYIDRCEVTNKQFKEFMDSGGYQNEKYWKEPFIKNGAVISWTDAVKEFTDSTGKPGPGTWVNGAYTQGQDNYPVAGVSWYEAAAYAEFVGKQLPTVYHWSKAGVTGGNYGGSVLPFSNFEEKGAAPVGQYYSLGDYGTYDMAGNVREWCWNQADEGKRYILGGAWNEPQYTFAASIRVDPFDRSIENGFRCMKDSSNGKILAKAYEPVIPQIRDFSREIPVSDEEFQIYKDSIYFYEQSDLNPVTITSEETSEYWHHEVVSIDTAYGNERMTMHLYLPKNTSPPYQVIVYFPGSAPLFLREYGNSVPPQFLLRSGRAVLCPIYKGTYERNVGLTTNRPNPSETYRNLVICWSKDLRRSIDYLQSRDDIQHDKIGYFGWSWGAALGAIMPAVEERIKTCVLVGAAFYIEPTRPEVDQINFAPHVKVPVLMINGQYDGIFPVVSAQKPMFDALGTPPEDKKHLLIQEGHLPKEKLNQETLSWLDKYLGPVKIGNRK